MIIVGDPRPDKHVECYACGWVGMIYETKVGLWLDMNDPTPVANGGDGKNYRCPMCKNKVDQIRYPKIKNVFKKQNRAN